MSDGLYSNLEEDQGLRSEEVEERSGFSQQYISDLERGRRNPTVITLYELARALGVCHTDLVAPWKGDGEGDT
jgi:transcriptional regulator with XRE-family HTH domain